MVGTRRAAALVAAGGLAAALVGRRREEDVAGKVVLVTGGSRGFGLLIAREYARAGAKLVLCARTPEELDAARRALEAEGAQVLTVPCDVSDRAQVDAMVRAATERFGRVDVLVNNAGIIQIGPAEAMSHEQYEQAMSVNFFGTLYATLAVLPQMIERRSGTILNVTSIGGKLAVPHLLPYTCAKWAQQGLSEGLRAELAQYNVRVTAVAPGTMRTGSYVNVEVAGAAEPEFRWFALSSSLPLLSIDAEWAARRAVRAARLGKSQEAIGLPAKAGALAHGLAPGTLSDVLGVVNRLLPGPAGAPPGRTELAREVDERMGSGLLRRATALGRSARGRYQHEPPADDR